MDSEGGATSADKGVVDASIPADSGSDAPAPPAATPIIDALRTAPPPTLDDEPETPPVADGTILTDTAAATAAARTGSPERQLGQRLIDIRTDQLASQMNSGEITYTAMNPGDRAIWTTYGIKGALAEGRGTTIDKQPDGTIEGVKMQVGDQEYTVVSIADGRPVDGKRVYSGKARDATGAEVPLPEISGDALAEAYAKKHADNIAANFKTGGADTPESQLVAHHAKGGEGALPSTDDIKNITERLDADPLQKVNDSLANQITLLEASLAAEGLPDEEINTKVTLLTELKLAEVAKGEVGTLLKLNALKRAQEQAGPTVANNIKNLLTEMQPQRTQAEQAVIKILTESGMAQNKIDKLVALVNTPDGMAAVLQDPDFAALPDFTNAVFGENLTDMEAANVDKLFEDFVDTHITKSQKERLIAAGLWTGKKAGILAAILLAIPAAIAAGTTVVVAGAAMGGAKR